MCNNRSPILRRDIPSRTNFKLETDVIRIIASIIDASTLQCNTVLIGSLIGSSQSASQLDGQNSARQAETLIGAEPHVGHSQ